MAFNEQEKEILRWGVENGKNKAEITQAISNYRLTGSPKGVSAPEPTPQKPLLEKAADVAVGAGKGLLDTAVGTARVLETAGQGFLAAIDPTLSFEEVQQRTGNPELRNPIVDETLRASNPDQKVGKAAAFVGELAAGGAGLLRRGLSKAAQAVAPTLNKAADTAAETASTAAQKAQALINPTRTPEEAIRQIAQGATEDLPAVRTALEAIDTRGVETFKQLEERISTTIPKLATKVDEELAKDATVYKLNDLTAKATTRGGAAVETDYISRALSNLSELYKTTGDAVESGNIAELIQRAKTVGLTRKEVNDISRQYGQVFGSKAFGKTGEPLTSVNAVAYENTRKGLKTIARQGLGGEQAKAIDATLAALYDTQRLVKKNVEAVNKLQQRIQERGLVEKAGYLVAKYADLLTGGSIRGFVGGVLPRGAGYKVMNALDIEEALRKNLDIVEQALKTKTDDELLNVLQPK